mgnify:CR=1 FL=1
MSEHTPGPWQVIPSWEDWTIEGPNKEEIIFQDGPYQTPTIKLENARLIAAAPELLEALEDAALALEDAGKRMQAAMARAAIAKTEGL